MFVICVVSVYNEKLYAKVSQYPHSFSDYNRRILLGDILSHQRFKFNVIDMKTDGMIETYFPLHNAKKRLDLRISFCVFPPKPGLAYNVQHAKEYFGPETGIFFGFLIDVLNQWYLLSGISVMVGLGLYIYESKYHDAEYSVFSTSPIIAIGCALYPLAGTLSILVLKHKENKRYLEWGLNEFSEVVDATHQAARKYYLKPASIDQSIVMYHAGRCTMYMTIFLLGMFSLLVQGVMLYVRYLCISRIENGELLANIIQSVIIHAMNVLYSSQLISFFNTKHNVPSQFQSAIIRHLYPILAINSYMSFFYVGFLKSISTFNEDDVCSGDCSRELTYFLLIYHGEVFLHCQAFVLTFFLSLCITVVAVVKLILHPRIYWIMWKEYKKYSKVKAQNLIWGRRSLNSNASLQNIHYSRAEQVSQFTY